jgi:DNA-binding winged helix-turn-helix (wHTH) protein
VTTRFLDCALDHEARLLSRAGAPVHLTPKAMEVLLLLVLHRPAAVSKAEVLERVWPGTFVTDASLARTVHEIRAAIGDRGAVAIRTVHGYGYAFQAQVHSDRTAAPAAPSDSLSPNRRAWLIVGGRAVPLTNGAYVIGRDPQVAFPVESRSASWHHARLTVTDDHTRIEDLGSKNGTLVRGERLVGVRQLQDDDDIVVGAVRLVFRTGARGLPTETSPPH